MNREQRRKLQREEARNQRKLNKGIPKQRVDLLISCPECHSIDVKQVRPDYFECNKCGSIHHLSEMSVDL